LPAELSFRQGQPRFTVRLQASEHQAGPSEIHLVATLYFDSLSAVKAGLASAQGQAAADLANFADGGAELYFFDTKDV
jgi:uncharacterized protein (TIGR02118 family)